MADPAPTGTVVPAPGADAAGSTDFKVPDGKALIDAAEYQGFQRMREQNAGYQQFLSTANKHGFKHPKDFEGYGKFQSFLKEKNLSTDDLMTALADEAKQAAKGDGASSAFDEAAFEKRLSSRYDEKLNSELTYRDALYEHKSAMAREQASMEKALAELTGETATDWDRAAIKAMLKEKADGLRGMYPDGHPLAPKDNDFSRAQLTAHDEKSLAAIVADIKKLRGLSAGSELKDLGDKAAAGKKLSTAAGSTSPSSTKHSATETARKRPDGKPLEEDVEAAFQKLQAARKGGPVSSAGG